MKNRLKAIFLTVILTVTVLLLTSCGDEGTPYDEYDNDGYTVSIKFDANGGTFTTNTSVLIDSYNPDDFSDGKLPLIAPDNSSRVTPLSPKKSGYFLAGWYTQREAVLDANGNHLDHDGNIAAESGNDPAYVYGDLWNFESDKFTIDASKTYSATEPALTLYAAWVPEFVFEFYSKDGAELIGKKTINPLSNMTITLPAWNLSTGEMNVNDFPSVPSKTFNGAYLGKDLSDKISSLTVDHSGVFNQETATYDDHVMKIYVDFIDGDWFKISTAEQFIKNATPSGNYIIEADLDFAGKSWPLSTATFRGSIIGNGHNFSNISAKQNSLGNNGGLFATIAGSAVLENINFVNATYTLAKGSRTNGATFGLLTGTVSEGATITGVTLSGKIVVSSNAQIPNIYNVGLVAGIGYDMTGIDLTGITAEALDDSKLYIATVTVDGNEVSVDISRKPS